MSTTDSKFDIWWNSPEVKQKVGAAYSLGASVVIIGAMFKILHLTGAATMLGVGMSVEAFLFALGIFDKPHKDYEWDKVYDFDGEPSENEIIRGTQPSSGGIQQNNGVVSQAVGATRAVGLNYTETINDDDVKKLSESIKNLTATAQQFAGLSTVIGATDLFVKNIGEATQATEQFVKNQQGLNGATAFLGTSYQGIADGMHTVDKNTKLYAEKVESINKNLASINSIYEIQLKNIQVQSESLTQQNERLKTVNEKLTDIVADVQKMKSATTSAATESESFKDGTTKLAKQVAELNQVYGNMLNALG